MKLSDEYNSIRDYYKANEIEGKPRTFHDLKSAILCSVIEYCAYWIDEKKEVHTFIQGDLLKINIITNEGEYKYRKYDEDE